MTRRDFELIADVIKHLPVSKGDYLQRDLIAKRFADKLSTTNALFDYSRFMDAACGKDDYEQEGWS